MRKKFSKPVLLSLSALFLLPAPAWAGDSGTAKEDSFEVSRHEAIEYVDNDYVGTVKKRDKEPVQAPVPDLSSANIVYFQINTDPNNRKPMPQIGGTLENGSLCLNPDGQVGVFRTLPKPINDTETPDFYQPANNPGIIGCVPFDPADLEAANLETVEEDGQLILRPIRVVLTVQDLASFPITPAPIHQQNPPHTLKKYHTNFWADPNPQEFTTTIAGRQVQVRATPVLYSFDYGDGTVFETTNPGYRLGEDVWDEKTPTSHQYQEAKDFTFQLTTTYRGEYSVEGGPWQVIDGTVEQTGEGQLVRVWQTKVGLVAGDR